MHLIEFSCATTTIAYLSILREADLSSVDPELIAAAVNKLDTVGLYWTEMTSQQIVAILTQAMVDTKLSNLTICTDENIDRDLIDQARKKIGILRIQKNLIF